MCNVQILYIGLRLDDVYLLVYFYTIYNDLYFIFACMKCTAAIITH